MQTAKPVFDRADTLLGICEAIGQDMGFNPLPLRIALAVSLLWNPVASLVAYAILGVAVLASRLVFPVDVVTLAAPEPVEARPVGDNDSDSVPAARAA